MKRDYGHEKVGGRQGGRRRPGEVMEMTLVIVTMRSGHKDEEELYS